MTPFFGCYSAGSSYEEAIMNTHEAINCHLEGLLNDNEALPTATSLEQHIHKKEYQSGVWAVIDIDLSQLSGKSKRINITLPERALRLIDHYAAVHHAKSRSALLTEAALSYMSQH